MDKSTSTFSFKWKYLSAAGISHIAKTNKQNALDCQCLAICAGSLLPAKPAESFKILRTIMLVLTSPSMLLTASSLFNLNVHPKQTFYLLYCIDVGFVKICETCNSLLLAVLLSVSGSDEPNWWWFPKPSSWIMVNTAKNTVTSSGV